MAKLRRPALKNIEQPPARLFDEADAEPDAMSGEAASERPLADRMRPKSLDDFVGQEKLIDSESLVVTRSYTYDETEVLAKASEEQILREALADDLARRVVRRIEALGATAALPPAAAPPTQP